MFYQWITYSLTLSFALSVVSAQENRVAVAHFITENVTGSIWFTETDEGLRVNGFINGKEPGLYGFHVHELGDILDCLDTGAHFNPEGTNHGGRNHTERHVGDLGNVVVENGTAYINFTDDSIALRGRNNILGRGLVVHEREDDLGLDGHPDSLTTGNAGARVACAVIGMHSPVAAWLENSSTNMVPSIGLLAIITMFSALVSKL